MTLPRRAVGLAVIACATIVLGLRGLGSGPQTSAAPAPVPAPAAPEAAAPRTAAPGIGGDRAGDLVSYALAVNELHGLPPNPAPGTEFELWVAWEPPVTKEPVIQRLLDRVVLEEVSPPLLPDGPHVANLLVERDEVRDLLYGDRYGSLSVTMPQS